MALAAPPKKGIRYTFGYDDLQSEAVVAGQRAYANWLEGKSTRWLLVTIALTLTITAPVTAILGFGSPAQVFDEVGIDMGGRSTWFSPYHLIAISDYMAMSKRTYTRATATANGTYNLVEQLIVPMEYPGRQMFASEVRFREDDTTKRVRFGYKLNSSNNGVAALVSGGTAAVTNVTVNVSQSYDDDLLADPPAFRPWWEQKRKPVSQTVVKDYIDLDLTRLLRGLTIFQNSSIGMVRDVLTRIQIAGGNYYYLGRNGQVDYQRWARAQEYEDFGADVFTTPGGGIIHVDFAKLKLSKALNPNQDFNFRLYYDATPSVTAGATASEIIVLEHLLERNPKLRSDGQYVTAPKLPPSLSSTAGE